MGEAAGFSTEWLDLREPADAEARDREMAAGVGTWLEQRGDAPLIVDLGCGAGATLRALAPHAPDGARWRLIDHDPALLAEAKRRHPRAEVVAADLASDDLAPLLAEADLVTCSALLDLVSAEWLDRFVAAVPASAAIYAALTVNGAMRWAPPGAPAGEEGRAPDDAAVQGAFLFHMTSDKGFGPALGAAAAPQLAMRVAAAGRGFAIADSPWRLTVEEDAELMAALADGVAAAVAEVRVQDVALDPSAWRATPHGVAEIGHTDLLAVPAA